MNYQDLLLSEQWKNKRKEILERDKSSCHRCGYLVNIFNYPYGIFEFDEKIELKELGLLNSDTRVASFIDKTDGKIFCKVPRETLSKDAYDDLILVVNFSLKKNIDYPYNGSIINNIKSNMFDLDNKINLNLSNKIKTECKEKLDFNKWEIDRQGYYLVHKSNLREYVKSNLQVHHRCYRKTTKVWEQKDEEYITLCNICHRIVHENQLIPYFNEIGDIYQYMEPCWKCAGQKYFNCYKNILNGVCFACNGNGYQNLKIV